ncbi:MAG TPA: DUF3467 domain-containing protein [candidate division Zixibacteria bacterium]
MQVRQQQINLEVGESEAEGIYSNMAMIVHSPQEFVIDFARVTPGARRTKVYARIIMTPAHAKMLHKALEDNIKKFESSHGQIKLAGADEKNIGFQSSPAREGTPNA